MKTLERICLFFGIDREVSRWFKKYGNQPISEIVKDKSEAQLLEFRSFFLSRPTHEVNAIIETFIEYCDHRVDECLEAINRQLQLLEQKKRSDAIAKINWTQASFENFGLNEREVPEHQNEVSVDWHKKANITVASQRVFTPVFSYQGTDFEFKNPCGKTYSFILSWEDHKWQNQYQPFLGKDDVYKPLPKNPVQIIQANLNNNKAGKDLEDLVKAVVYNKLINERLAEKKLLAAENIKAMHTKEKIRYRLKHLYKR